MPKTPGGGKGGASFGRGPTRDELLQEFLGTGLSGRRVADFMDLAETRARQELGSVSEGWNVLGERAPNMDDVVRQAPSMAAAFLKRMQGMGAKPATINKWMKYAKDEVYDPAEAMAENYPRWLDRRVDSELTSAEKLLDRFYRNISGQFDEFR